MQKRLLLVLTSSLLLAGPLLLQAAAQSSGSGSSSTTFYRWVDADGVVHFSDSPRPGADDPSRYEYTVRSPNTSRPPPRRSPASDASTTGDADTDTEPADSDPAKTTGYTSLSISAPSAGDTLWNIGGTLNVRVQLSPGLRAGDGIIILMDGQLMTPRPSSSTSITLSNVYRGEHVLVAAVRDASGQQIIASAPIRFVVQQSTVN